MSAGRKGGELASAVHAYGKTGDPQMRALVQHILSLVSHPIINFLYRWIYDGELEDTYHEVRSFPVWATSDRCTETLLNATLNEVVLKKKTR